VPQHRFVHFIENHDQVANSGDGSRVRTRTSPGRYRAMTALMILMPGVPMLFQGQEFGATTPFLYFADHNPELAAAVRKGRAEFVSQFASLATPAMTDTLAPPDDESTFARSKLDWTEFDRHVAWRRFFKDLLEVRAHDVAFASATPGDVDGAVLAHEAFVLRYFTGGSSDERLLLVNLGPDLIAPSLAEPLIAPPAGHEWRTRWSSESPDYGGAGSPEVVSVDGWRIAGHSAVVLRAEEIDGGHRANRR
jgi:maltooligosyltrehalose trehalohydrolase